MNRGRASNPHGRFERYTSQFLSRLCRGIFPLSRDGKVPCAEIGRSSSHLWCASIPIGFKATRKEVCFEGYQRSRQIAKNLRERGR